ncbi:MAG: hypothetical protein K8T26_08125 [Lentisphaerae bacterium]|nr:hypothetical protein [Lentisphaerota bacterium]
MYESLMGTLRACFSYGATRTVLLAASGVVMACLAAWAAPAFRAVVARGLAREGWRGGLTGGMTGSFKILLLLLLARLCMTILSRQADLFEHQHGRVTEENRSAVLMKWGYPHEQSELEVRHTRERIWVTRQLQVEEKDKDPRILTECYWKDEAPPVQAVNGRLPTVFTTREETRDVPVNQRSVTAAEIAIHVRNNPRRLGNANYAGYEDDWQLRYTVMNRSAWDTTAHLSFPLPAETGLFDDLDIRIDDQLLDTAEADGESALTWELPMTAGTSRVVSIRYHSRGLEYLRYIPQRMTQTGRYRVALTVEGVPPGKLDYPIGSMPPAENLATIATMPYTLTWKLDNALTSYDLGIRLPEAEQPDYHFTHLLAEAPVGAAWLLAMLTLPRLILGLRVRPAIVALLAALYMLHYTLMGRLADILSGFAAPFAISATLLPLTVLAFRIADRQEGWFPRLQDAAVFTVLAVLYPLMIVDHDRTDLWMQILIMLNLFYLCMLCAFSWRRAVARPRLP